MTNHVVLIIQARMGSTRLLRKLLMSLAGLIKHGGHLIIEVLNLYNPFVSVYRNKKTDTSATTMLISIASVKSL